jgi:hypothetical protein
MATQTSISAEQLKSTIKGSVLSASDAGYEDARQIWNAMIDRRPALIVRCAEAADVPAAIAFARRYRLEISMKPPRRTVSPRPWESTRRPALPVSLWAAASAGSRANTA